MRLSFRRPFVHYSDVVHDADSYLHRSSSRPFTFPTVRFEDRIRTSFEYYQSVLQTEYVFRYKKPVIIEPVQGWAITKDNKLLYESIPFSKDRGLNFPSFLRTNYARLTKKTVQLKTAVSIRYSWQNYFHVLNDAIGQFYMLDEFNVPDTMPVIIPSFATETLFGRFFFENLPILTKRPLVIQKAEVVTAEDVLFVKNIPNVTKHFKAIAKDLNLPSTGEKFPARVFLTRKGTYFRNISNADEVHTFMKDIGYTVVDAAAMSVASQIQMFMGLTHIVAVHGAGLTNLAFGSSQLRIIEIFPANSIPPHFFWLASGLGLEYEAQTHGEESHGNFRIDVDALRTFMADKGFI